MSARAWFLGLLLAAAAGAQDGAITGGAVKDAGGDVTGPASVTDNTVVRWDGTSGDTLQGSGVTIDDSNNVTGIVDLTATDQVIGDDAQFDTLTNEAGTGAPSLSQGAVVANTKAITCAADGGCTLGASGTEWAVGWLQSVDDGDGTVNIDAACAIVGTATITGNVMPEAGDTRTVGASGTEYSAVWANTLDDGDGTIAVDAHLALGTFSLTGAGARPERYTFDAGMLLATESGAAADWSVDVFGGVAADTNVAAFPVVSFDQSTSEGAGFIMTFGYNPATVYVSILVRAETTPAGADAVFDIHYRCGGDNENVGAWVTSETIGTADFGSDELWQVVTTNATSAANIASGVSSGDTCMFELVRDVADASDTAAVDVVLASVRVEVNP